MKNKTPKNCNKCRQLDHCPNSNTEDLTDCDALEPMTNGDKLRGMNNEELAGLFVASNDLGSYSTIPNVKIFDENFDTNKVKKSILNWLNQEANES